MANTGSYQEYINTFPRISEIENMVQFCRCHKQVYIYGTSDNSEYIAKYLNTSGVPIEGYLVTDAERYQFNIFHLPVFAIDDLSNQESVGVLLCLADEHQKDFIENTYKFDIFRVSEHNCQRITNCLRPHGVKMRQIEINVVDHCNLCCSSCNHFSNLVEEEYFLDFEEYSRDISRLSEICSGNLKVIKLLGGEPLLHPDIVDFIKVTRIHFPYSNISFVTNGLLLLKMGNEFWKSLIEYNVFLRVTKYPIGLDYAKILNKAAVFGIINSNLNNSGHFSENKGHMIKFPFDLSGNQEKYYFINCHHRIGCTVLRHGKIYPCPQIAYIDYFNKQFNKTLNVTENDYIELHKIKSYYEIEEFLSNRVPFCDYCDIKHRYHPLNKFEWRKSAKDIEEYLWS
ncbi:MAG: radical SAM protein [Prevotella sp.]|jgi:MoaA/NifB/PqqE/SkfB family radical SAM enzyme|nr:radical SAM protein [Prevotella sp.]